MTSRTWIISSRWNHRTNSLDGWTYESLEDAMSAIRKLVGNDVVKERVDGADACNWLVYPDQESADTDVEGAAPYAACAAIAEVVET